MKKKLIVGFLLMSNYQLNGVFVKPPAITKPSTVLTQLSTTWLVLGAMPYIMGISDNPHVTKKFQTVLSLIYFGVPACGLTLAGLLKVSQY